jgi:hypothetical protein
MTSRPDHRAPSSLLRPSPAERAPTVAGGPVATVCAPGIEPRLALAHSVTGEGQVLLVVPAGGPIAAAPDRAPVPLRSPVRAGLLLSGWATPVPARDARPALLAFADTRPAPELLDVGRTATLLRLDVAEVVLGEGTTGTEIGPAEFAAARPDPLAGLEAAHLAQIDSDHPEVLDLLRDRLDPGELGPGDVLRPLGLDRYGLRLRIERPGGHRDLRFAFPAPLTCPGQLGAAMRQLLGCAGLARRPA